MIRLIFASLFVLSCSPQGSGPLDSGRDASDSEIASDAAQQQDATVDSAVDSGPTLAAPTVNEGRQLRAIWFTTAYALDWPNHTNREEQQRDLELYFDLFRDVGLQAVFFQVRPESDALYHSAHEPWSRVLTGEQGRDPGWDPLAFAIQAAHDRGLQLHAWVNPFRCSTNSSTPFHASHLGALHPEVVIAYGSARWCDPGSEIVQSHVVNVVSDLLTHYAVDGLVFDDYFYPYPDGMPFADDASFAQFTTSGGTLSREDWRRDNINRFLTRIAAEALRIAPTRPFGVSPFGIYRPGQPEGVRGLDSVSDLHADSLHWIQSGIVDYLAPQLYWPTSSVGQPFEPLARWWTTTTTNERPIVTGLSLDRIGAVNGWDLAEFERQLMLSQSSGHRGFALFRAEHLRASTDIQNVLRRALVPSALPFAPPRGATPTPVEVHRDGTALVIEHDNAVWLHVKTTAGNQFVRHTHPATRLAIGEPAYVSAIDEHFRESPPVLAQ